MQKVNKRFSTKIKLRHLLIKADNLAISANPILFSSHFFIMGKVKPFYFCADNSLSKVIIYKNKDPFFPNCLSISLTQNKSGFNCILIFKIFSVIICNGVQNRPSMLKKSFLIFYTGQSGGFILFTQQCDWGGWKAKFSRLCIFSGSPT